MTLPRPLRGIVPPLVTPLASMDELDYEGLERLIERVIAAGCSGVFVLGSTGEAQALSYRLRCEMVQQTCQFVQGRIPVLAGISDTSVVESIKFGRACFEAGADATVVSTPYYFRMGQSDLLRHAEMLARELQGPLFLYNMPGLTKLTYEPDTVGRAAEIENVVGFKDSSGDLIYLQRVLTRVRKRPEFSVLIGPEELLVEAIALGAHGGITGGANLRPELYVALYKAATDGGGSANELRAKVLELSEALYRVGEPATSYVRGIKCALGIEGICSPIPAAPLAPFEAQERAAIAQWLGR
jgi:4-hydroxy-tetrahydrodipicolinate synthase